MASKQQQTGMRGVYLVAAELAARGFIVSPTSRSALGADLLVTDPDCRRAFSVQVKSNAGRRNAWLLSPNAKTIRVRSHIYVFVNLDQKGRDPEYYVVPSPVVSRNVDKVRRPRSTWYSFGLYTAQRYKDCWTLFRR